MKGRRECVGGAGERAPCRGAGRFVRAGTNESIIELPPLSARGAAPPLPLLRLKMHARAHVPTRQRHHRLPAHPVPVPVVRRARHAAQRAQQRLTTLAVAHGEAARSPTAAGHGQRRPPPQLLLHAMSPAQPGHQQRPPRAACSTAVRRLWRSAHPRGPPPSCSRSPQPATQQAGQPANQAGQRLAASSCLLRSPHAPSRCPAAWSYSSTQLRRLPIHGGEGGGGKGVEAEGTGEGIA